jgi:hypothetical protein
MKTAYLSTRVEFVGDREECFTTPCGYSKAPDLHVCQVSPVYETEPQSFRPAWI